MTTFVKHLTIIVKHWLTIFCQQSQFGKQNRYPVKPFSITISWLQISWPFSHLLRVQKPSKKSFYLFLEQFEVLYQYILFNCSLCPSQYPHLFWLLMAFPKVLLVPLMISEIFENMQRLKKLQTFIFPLIRYFKLPCWILHIPSYCQSHPKGIIVDWCAWNIYNKVLTYLHI